LALDGAADKVGATLNGEGHGSFVDDNLSRQRSLPSTAGPPHRRRSRPSSNAWSI
jgi:hypothetical protein